MYFVLGESKATQYDIFAVPPAECVQSYKPAKYDLSNDIILQKSHVRRAFILEFVDTE
jgi:hypothetical protein